MGSVRQWWRLRCFAAALQVACSTLGVAPGLAPSIAQPIMRVGRTRPRAGAGRDLPLVPTMDQPVLKVERRLDNGSLVRILSPEPIPGTGSARIELRSQKGRLIAAIETGPIQEVRFIERLPVPLLEIGEHSHGNGFHGNGLVWFCL